jgi:ABC-type phosphate transport system permease subunit
MVPDDFVAFFATAATAAGALIGLLFVAASLRPETVLGKNAPPAARAVAGSAFTALVNSFFVSLIACIPGTRLGYTAAVMALISLWGTLRTHLPAP